MTDYHQRTEKLIQNIASGSASEEEAQFLIRDIKAEMKSAPAIRKQLGPLLPMINKALKSRVEVPQFTWVKIDNGYLAVGHKPGGKISFEGMKQAGVTAVLTLLQENEGSQQIGQALHRVGIEWLWFPFSAVRPQERSSTEALFQKMKPLLEQEAKIYIHCSAGIHRTGMITYAFLRYLGHTPAEAMDQLARMRQLTADGFTPERLSWGDQFGA